MLTSMTSGSAKGVSAIEGASSPAGGSTTGSSSTVEAQSMEGLWRSLAKMFGGTGARANAIFASSSASSLNLHAMWLSSRPSNLSSRRRTSSLYASILGSWQLDSFIT